MPRDERIYRYLLEMTPHRGRLHIALATLTFWFMVGLGIYSLVKMVG